MTVQTDLQITIDAYIQANFAGTTAAISASKLTLENLLFMQASLKEIGINGTVQGNLYTAIDNYIQSNFTGTLAEISATKLPLENLLRIQESLLIIGA
jgi:hypothetical protein